MTIQINAYSPIPENFEMRSTFEQMLSRVTGRAFEIAFIYAPSVRVGCSAKGVGAATRKRWTNILRVAHRGISE